MRRGPLSTTTPPESTATADDAHQLRRAVAGVLGTAGDDALPAPDPAWRDGWPALVELGLLALCVPEEQGGIGHHVVAAAGAAAELGAALHGSPYAGLVAGTHALAGAARGGDDRAAALLAEVLAGGRVVTVGRLGPDGRTARSVDGVPGADAVVLEQGDGGLLLADDPSAWAADPAGYGFDVSRSTADVTIDPAAAHPLPADPAAALLADLLLAADALGGTERVLDHTVAYARDRQAFGRAIGGFQAVQHRLADHAVRVRGMRLLVGAAGRAMAEGDPLAPSTGVVRRVALAGASVGGGAVHVLHDLLQLTGAIGFTWEHGLHHFERRAHQSARSANAPRAPRLRLARIQGWTDAGPR